MQSTAVAKSFESTLIGVSTMRFGVGVIGATGYIATPYRREIREAKEDAAIVALCARRRDPLEAAGKEDGAAFTTNDWREVVEHPRVNFVIVATPDALHHEAVKACARHGKHLLCEKPLGVNAAQAHEMWTAYRDAGLGHFVPFWTRYVPVFARAKCLVAEGLLGNVRAVIYRWHNPRPAAMPFTWRDDASLSAAGSIADVGSHAYDTMRWILGAEARRVLAHAAIITPPKPDVGAVNLDDALKWGESHGLEAATCLRKGTAYDYAAITFEFASGAVGSLVLSHATYLRKGLAPELELHGTAASLAVDRITGNLALVRPGQQPQILETVPDPGFGNRFAKHVFPAIRARAAGQRCDYPGLEDGWRVQLFTDAAAKSARRGTWVEVGESC